MYRILLFTFFSSFSIHLSAQSVVKSAAASTKEEKKMMSQGEQNAIVIEVPAKPDFVEDEWKDFLETYKAKPKWNKKEKEWFSDNAIISEIGGSSPIDVYARIEPSGSDASRLILWLDLGGAYLSSYQHTEQFRLTQNMLRDFSIKVQKDLTQKEFEKEEKKQKKNENHYKDLVKDKEDLLKDIENYKAKIKKAEEDIIKNDKNQKDTQKAIEEQKGVIKNVQERLDALNKA